jgi:uncharacterized protein
MIENVKMIKDCFPEYYRGKVGFNTVVDPSNSFSCISDFIVDSEIFEDMTFSSSFIEFRYTEKRISENKDFNQEWEYELFKLYLKKLGWMKHAKVSRFMESHFLQTSVQRGGKQFSSMRQLPEKMHHGGPCIPGALRLFVSADGALYPCERVSETSDMTRLGSLEEGIDLKRAARILNVEQETSAMCRNCWGYLYCTACVGWLDNMHELSAELLRGRCAGIRNGVETTFKDYCSLKEIGYDFDAEGVGSRFINF